MRTLLTISLTFIIFIVSHAQVPKEKWGNPTNEELTMAYCALDPLADAAVLNNYGHYYFNRHYYFSNQELRSFYHYQVRLKVFTEKGKKFATVNIPFKGFDEYENVIEISGATYNLDANGKLIKSKLKVKNAQWTRNGRNLWNCSFTLPDVKVGSVIEYTYKVASLDFVQLRDWKFQESIPVLNSDITLTTPNFYQYAFFSNLGLDRLQVTKSDKQQYIQFYNLNIYCNGTEIKLAARNIPSFQKEIWMPDSSRQLLKGEFLLVSALTRPMEFSHIRDYYLMPYLKPLLLTTTEDYYQPQQRIGLYMETVSAYKMVEGMDWESFVKKLNKKEEFGKNMLKAFENKWLIDSFRKVENGKKRMIAIYDYVKRNMNWNGEYRILASNSLEKIFEKKTGYSADINMLLINLLNRSSIQAKPVLISTRSYGNVYKEVGFFRKFNHVIASVELEGRRYLLDAIDSPRPFDILNMEDLNGEGLLVNLLDYQWVPLINTSSSEIIQSEKINILPEGSFQSETVTNYSGYPALQKRQELNNYSVDSANEIVENLQNESQPLIVKGKQVDSLTNLQDGSFSLSPLSINSLVENPLISEIRINPVDLKFERSLIRELNIQIPEGYSLISYPNNRSFTMHGGFVKCSLNSQIEANTLKLYFKFDINNAYIPSQFYSELKILLESIKDLEQEKVVFKKN